MGRAAGFRPRAERGQQRALERQRREQEEAHLRFLRRLDHEIKNPLTAIRAALANLPGSPEGSALSGVQSQVDRLARLSADLRKLAALERQPLEQEPVDLTELLTELLALGRERPQADQLRLRLSLPQAPWPLPCVAGDRDLLYLAFHNLLDNALKFARSGDTLEIRAFEDGSWVVVEVADTGPGVPQEELPHLGEELYRGRAARGAEGSGLGLALVRAVVARHQGLFSVRSRLEEGTVVSVRLPAGSAR